MNSKPAVLFATFSNPNIPTGSTVNDAKFVSLLEEIVPTEVCFVGGERRMSTLMRAYVRLGFLFASRRYHRIVICRGAFEACLAKLVGRKVFLHVATIPFHTDEIRNRILPVLFRFQLIDFLIFYSAELIAVTTAEGFISSNREAGQILVRRSNIDPGKIALVPFFVEESFFAVPDKKRGNGALKVGYTGNFLPHDIIPELIRATQLCSRKGISLELTLAGDGPLFQAAKQEAEQVAGIKVSFTGRIRHVDVPSFLGELDVLTCPLSPDLVSSSLPIRILEAAAAGKAIITTNSGAVRSTFGDSMIYVNKPYAENIADTLANFSRDPRLIDDLGRKARNIALSNFTRSNARIAIKSLLLREHVLSDR